MGHGRRAELAAKYAGASGVDAARIEGVDVVWRDGPLHEAFPAGELGGYHALIASHVLEHLPDLAGFLASAGTLLRPGSGVLALALPDKRYCFDCFRPVSTTGQALAAHLAGAVRHSRRTAFDEAAYSATLGGRPEWSHEPAGGLRFAHSLDEALEFFRTRREDAASPYADFHAWQFTPASFELIVLEPVEAGVADCRVGWIEPQPAVEFLVRLRRGRERFISAEAREERRLALLRRILAETREQADWALADITAGTGSGPHPGPGDDRDGGSAMPAGPPCGAGAEPTRRGW